MKVVIEALVVVRQKFKYISGRKLLNPILIEWYTWYTMVFTQFVSKHTYEKYIVNLTTSELNFTLITILRFVLNIN